ncbi:MAG: ketopantoate reductase C-terminal domain-containing protein, partial [Flavobacteriales bacterium]|nr:ketopantoate reductase C-terminal domain-containing protein [Flavobacteriales bacterium]
KCKVFASLDGVETPDLVVFGVKSYDLDTVIKKVQDAYGRDIPILSVLNGVRHLEVLRKEFTNVIFATIGFNAYRTSSIMAVATGGSLVLSSSDNEAQVVQTLYKSIKRKVSVSLAKNPMDAAHCKLVINLGNVLLTITGFDQNRKRQLPELQQLMANLLWEGVRVMRKKGVKEVRVPGMPPWIFLWLSKVLPSSITLPIFKKKMRFSAINSLAQDLKSGSKETELEDINGYFLKLAQKVGVAVPYNEAIYELFKEWQQEGAQPLTPKEVLSKINSFSKR